QLPPPAPDDDLVKVTDIARSMVMRYGMEEKLGHVTYEAERPLFLGAPGALAQGREFSEETAREIDRAVREIVDRAFGKAAAILTRSRAVLEQGAQLLLERETLGEDDLARLRPQQLAIQGPKTADAAVRLKGSADEKKGHYDEAGRLRRCE